MILRSPVDGEIVKPLLSHHATNDMRPGRIDVEVSNNIVRCIGELHGPESGRGKQRFVCLEVAALPTGSWDAVVVCEEKSSVSITRRNEGL